MIQRESNHAKAKESSSGSSASGGSSCEEKEKIQI